MTRFIAFASPSDEPFGCLHPAIRYRGAFREEDGTYWSTVAQYCIAQELASSADRDAVRKARDVEQADELAKSMTRVPDAEVKAFDVLRHGLRCSFETNLDLRAVLVSTGDATIEAEWPRGVGENILGRALMEVRAIVQQRANDTQAIQC
ncbi:MAG: NADAR family protein, partial [Polyangiaceae bacterium]